MKTVESTTCRGNSMKTSSMFFVVTVLATLFASQNVLAHVTISPGESTTGAQETYTIRVPTERDSPTVRIEIAIPAGVAVSAADFEVAPGWELAVTSGTEGKVEAAVWSGGSIAPDSAQEFRFAAQNPTEETMLVWKVIQIHSDGSRAEWVGEVGSRNPAPVVDVK